MILRRLATRIALLTSFFIGVGAASVSAETLMMPSRDMLAGGQQVVWGVTTLANHTTAVPTTYTIDFGDGTADAAGNVTDRSYIAVTHTFPASGTFTVTLEVTRAGITETATTVVRVFDAAVIGDEQVRAVRINSAIEDGLRYLWVNQSNRGANFPAGVTTNWGSSYPESFAALIVLAFENHGFRLANNDDAPIGLYEKYIVRRGLNFVIDSLRQLTLTAQSAGDPCVNVDDGPAPCEGLRLNQQQEGYATALAILPLAASNALTRHVTEIAGTQNAGFVVGRTFGEVLQRLVNAMAWGQGESGFARGGWAYSFNAGNTDGSTIGWNVLALLDAAAAGITIPPFVKTEFVNFAIPFGLNNDGTFDYTSGNNPAVAQGGAGANMAKNGIGVQAMFYADIDRRRGHACRRRAQRDQQPVERPGQRRQLPLRQQPAQQGVRLRDVQRLQGVEAAGHHHAARRHPAGRAGGDSRRRLVRRLRRLAAGEPDRADHGDGRALGGTLVLVLWRGRGRERRARGTDHVAGGADRARPDALQHDRPRPDHGAARAGRHPYGHCHRDERRRRTRGWRHRRLPCNHRTQRRRHRARRHQRCRTDNLYLHGHRRRGPRHDSCVHRHARLEHGGSVVAGTGLRRRRGGSADADVPARSGLAPASSSPA